MDFARHNADLKILTSPEEFGRPRYGHVPPWRTVDWKGTRYGGNMLYIRDMVLPPVCSRARTDVKIEAPPNLYEPAGNGKYHFYRNMWIAPGLEVWDARRRCWDKLPRLFNDVGDDGFSYICIHPRFGSVDKGKNILHFLRVLDLHLLNPGLHATSGEAL